MGHWVLDGRLEGCPVFLRLGSGSVVFSVDPALLLATDLTGRPWRVVEGDNTYRWKLSGGALLVRRGADGRRVLRRLEIDEAAEVWEGIRHRLEPVLRATVDWQQGELRPVAGAGERLEAVEESRGALLDAVERVSRWNAAALRKDAEAFTRVYSPVGILPPDLYQALVLQATTGCSFNSCTFCGLFRQVPFQVRSPDELEAHIREVDRYLGLGASLRRNIFLGAANALTLPVEVLVKLLEVVGRQYATRLSRGEGIFSFLDAFSGSRKSPGDFRRLSELGLQGVCVGMESGHDPLLAWLRKPGQSEDAAKAVKSIKEAGLQVSVVVLLGAGGKGFESGHAGDTASLLASLPLERSDIVYFSELFPDSASPYQDLSARDGIEPLTGEERWRQREKIAKGLLPVRDGGPRQAVYDIREFTY